jgi:O-antigen ligase
LVETGVIGLALFLLFLGFVFRAGVQRMLHEPASVVSAASLGCSGLLLHSFTDFNLHVAANAAIFFALCGVICTASE